MDSSITAAGRALRAGDPLGALKRVALRDDPAALALRGIAMAQLGDLTRARELLRRRGRAFGPRETLERARCLTAEAEVALAARDLAAAGARAGRGAAHASRLTAIARTRPTRGCCRSGAAAARAGRRGGGRARHARSRRAPAAAGGRRRAGQLRDRAAPRDVPSRRAPPWRARARRRRDRASARCAPRSSRRGRALVLPAARLVVGG